MEKIIVTGCAGFIGSHVCEKLLKENYIVYGIDNMNDYYDVKIKELNLQILNKYDNFTFKKEDICDTKLISECKPYKIIHLASMAGVRYSLKNPKKYCKNNIEGFIHILEECIKNNVKHIYYASSSSVYGLNKKLPFNEEDEIMKCNSPYAASKYSMEIFAKTYSQLYDIKTTGFRFFTVYGPRGRPDMAPYKFLNAIMNNKKFDKYGDGSSSRDYTYIDDIVNGIYNSLIMQQNNNSEIYNLGNSYPITLNNFIEICEKITGKKAQYNLLEEQLGDVPHTYADIDKSKKNIKYNPTTSLYDGLNKTYNYLIKSKINK
jgi:UDP-glucuronate 4-epimerase